MSYDLQVLANNRDALLLAEIAAWLHMFGKLHEVFLYGNHDLAEKIPSDIQYNFPDLYKLLKEPWTGCIWKILDTVVPELKAEDLSIFDLIKDHQTYLKELHDQNASGFLKLMVDAHGRGSGPEKGLLVDFAPKQEKRVYLSTSLGYEAPSYIALPTIYTLRQFFYGFLETFLKELKEYIENPGNHDVLTQVRKWQNFRREFLQKLKQTFPLTVADTRRPLNDVTLLDQTLASVAFFKAALAQNLLNGWKEPYQEKVEDKYRWRLLRVGLNSLAFWRNSVRIGDILARKNLIEDGLDEVQSVLEITYPLGMEVYRDENGSIFIVPDIDNLDRESYIDETQSLKDYIQDLGYKGFSSETTFTVSLEDKTRNMLSFGNLVARPITQAVAKFDLHQWQNVRDVCPVCGIRPQGPDPKAISRKICNECLSRRINRSEKWTNDLSSTIWIDEVADINGRVALIVTRFDLTSWLSGTSFNTVLGFDISPRRLDKIDLDFDLAELIEVIKEGLEARRNPTFKNNTLLGKLVPSEEERGSPKGTPQKVKVFYDLHILGTDLADIDDSIISKEERLTLEMIRLSPSFSRIYRVWRTTQTFWKDIVFDFIKTVGRVSPRLKITFTSEVGLREVLAISHTYELKVDNINLSVIYTGNDEFIIVDNLLRTASLLDPSGKSSGNTEKAVKCIKTRLSSGKEVDIEEPTGYGAPNKRVGKLSIEKVTEEETPYIPAITILTEPRTFMALVPADKVLNVAEAIEKNYQEEMGAVRNRLPLKMGIVFAGKRTPLPAILDAGWRMLNQPIIDEAATDKCWAIDRIDRSSLPKEVGLTLKKGESSLPIKVPIMRGDEETKDAWYPYWCVEKDINGAPPSERRRKFKGINGKYWVHVCDLRQGDQVHFMPSHFDFEFLDTATRRFEVSYEGGTRRDSHRKSRPYYLEQLEEFETLWDVLSKKLSKSQIENLIGIIETKRQEWEKEQDKHVFEQVVRDALNNANWKSHPKTEKFEQLCTAAMSGQLADVVELYMSILKCQVKVD